MQVANLKFRGARVRVRTLQNLDMKWSSDLRCSDANTLSEPLVPTKVASINFLIVLVKILGLRKFWFPVNFECPDILDPKAQTTLFTGIWLIFPKLGSVALPPEDEVLYKTSSLG
jgi:hypothetical protein